MTPEPPASVAESFEQALAERQRERYVLRLYVTGMTDRSARSIGVIKAICEQLLPGRYELEVVDLLDRPELAEEKQIVAVPTLIKELPLPIRRLVGDLTNRDRVIMVMQQA